LRQEGCPGSQDGIRLYYQINIVFIIRFILQQDNLTRLEFSFYHQVSLKQKEIPELTNIDIIIHNTDTEDDMPQPAIIVDKHRTSRLGCSNDPDLL
jgi:hypothetical protein